MNSHRSPFQTQRLVARVIDTGIVANACLYLFGTLYPPLRMLIAHWTYQSGNSLHFRGFFAAWGQILHCAPNIPNVPEEALPNI